MQTIISDDYYQHLHEYCAEYINRLCIWRAQPGEWIEGKQLGTRYTWQFYMRRGLFNPGFAKAISLMYLRDVQQRFGDFNFQIAGLETASTPLIMSIALTAYDEGIDLNCFSVRKDQKSYGLKNWFEGPVLNDVPVMVCDDLANSANSMSIARDIIEAHNIPLIDTVFAVVNKRNRPAGSDFNLPKHVDIMSLFNLDDFNLHYPEK